MILRRRIHGKEQIEDLKKRIELSILRPNPWTPQRIQKVTEHLELAKLKLSVESQPARIAHMKHQILIHEARLEVGKREIRLKELNHV